MTKKQIIKELKKEKLTRPDMPSYAVLARSINMDRSHFLNILNGKRGASVEMVQKIAEAMGFKVEITLTKTFQ